MRRLLRWSAFALLCALFFLLLTRPQAAALGAGEGLRLCAETVIPSLLPFLVLSGTAVRMGAAAALGALLYPLLGPALDLSRTGCGALALGLLGGCPAGAQTVRSLWESGQCSKAEAERLLAFCNNCSPAFLLGAAGSGVFHSPRVGVLLLAGHWLGSVSVGLVFRFYGKREKTEPPAPAPPASLSTALTRSVTAALAALGNICAYTVLFRVAARLIEDTGLLDPLTRLPNALALSRGLLELTGGLSSLRPDALGAVELAAALLGLGGASVLCQTLAVLEDSALTTWPAAAGKLLHALFAALWTHALLCVPTRGIVRLWHAVTLGYALLRGG